jgi:hypothetical protein
LLLLFLDLQCIYAIDQELDLQSSLRESVVALHKPLLQTLDGLHGIAEVCIEDLSTPLDPMLSTKLGVFVVSSRLG